MSMTQTQQHNMPSLRFPEFSGGWEERKLGEIVKIERGRFSPRPRNDPKYYGGEIPFVQTSDVVNSKGKIREYSQTLNNLGLGVSKLFPKGSLLITIAANIGYAGVLEIDMACPDSLIGLTCSKALNNYFLNYILEIEQPKMDYLAVEAAQKNINIEFLKPYIVAFPKLPEQQKIASFLSSVDGKIEQLGKKKALLEQYKKGMMQKLFSQELRFKDAQGNDFPDWEEKRVSDVFRVTRGSVLAVSKMTQTPQGSSVYPVYSSQTKKNGLTGYFPEYLYENAITWTTDGANAGDVKYREGKFYCTNVCGVLISEDGFANTCVAELLNRITERFVSYVGNPKLMNNVMAQIKIQYPAVPEQQKIADFLSSIDRKIDLVFTELNHAKTFKKGLLQQMFI